MTFSFEGSELVLFGRSRFLDGGEPRWRCMVDDRGVPAEPGTVGGRFSCSWNGSPAINHTFQLVMESTLGSVSVDSLWYPPTWNSTRLDESWVVYNHNDPNVSFTSGKWKPLTHGGDNATVTDDKNLSMTFIFTGTDVMAQGWSASGYPAGKSTGSYSLNNGSWVSFELMPPNPPSETIHGKQLFKMTDLDPGVLHTLVVTFNGPSTPLVLDNFLVKNGNFRVEPEPEPPRDTGRSPGPSSASDNSPDPLSKILSIAIPTVVGFFLFIFLLRCFPRIISGCFACFRAGRRKRQPEVPSEDYANNNMQRPIYPPDQQMAPQHSGSYRDLTHGEPGSGRHSYPPSPVPLDPRSNTVQGNTVQGFGDFRVNGGHANIAGRDNYHSTIHQTINVQPAICRGRSLFGSVTPVDHRHSAHSSSDLRYSQGHRTAQ
ncbi:hypothetical protein BKA70DRAFT_1293464 [Coprinopsis sp. MPI-PUGE-AT-0042]|nr:hypothetical protein BKA70DRAFT_1293464 [Coprinopsis sp. MPI-PUGE-AT-0042]